jgi:type VI protein secretion system component VasF
MDYLACLTLGFLGGLACGLHLAEAMLDNIRRKLEQLEQPKPAADDELAEDFA